jgi:hypothetical protein
MQIHFPPCPRTIPAARPPRDSLPCGTGRRTIPRSRYLFLILASLRPRTTLSTSPRAPCHFRPVPRPCAHPTSISHPCKSTSRRAREQSPPPLPPAHENRKTSKMRLPQMSLCLSKLPQNGDPKWELSLASYENRPLSERQLWTISGVFYPQCLFAPPWLSAQLRRARRRRARVFVIFFAAG